MSKIGKKYIYIPKNIKIKENIKDIKFEGPIGIINFIKNKEIKINILKNKIILSKNITSKNTRKIWGLSRALINNIIKGITSGYTQKLEIIGVGYKVYLKERFLLIKIGYSHDIAYAFPKTVKIKCINNIIEIKSHDKQLVGQICSDIKNIRKINPYKGKGIKTLGEKIFLKQGKKK